MDGPNNVPPQISIESHSNVNLCPVYYLKGYLCFTEPFMKKSNGCCVYSLFLGDNRQQICICAKIISSVVRKVLGIVKLYIYLPVPSEVWQCPQLY